MEIIEMNGYTLEEKVQIARRHLLPKQLVHHGLGPSQLKLAPNTLDNLIAGYTREAGVRELDRLVAALCRNVAARIAEMQGDGEEGAEDDAADKGGVVDSEGAIVVDGIDLATASLRGGLRTTYDSGRGEEGEAPERGSSNQQQERWEQPPPPRPVAGGAGSSGGTAGPPKGVAMPAASSADPNAASAMTKGQAIPSAEQLQQQLSNLQQHQMLLQQLQQQQQQLQQMQMQLMAQGPPGAQQAGGAQHQNGQPRPESAGKGGGAPLAAPTEGGMEGLQQGLMMLDMANGAPAANPGDPCLSTLPGFSMPYQMAAGNMALPPP